MAGNPVASEPFPSFEADEQCAEVTADTEPAPSARRASLTSRMSTTTRSRTSSLARSFIASNPPLGMWQATGEVGSKIPTLPEIRNGAFAGEGWSHEGQMEHRGTNPHEIHRRRVARTSSASTRTRKSSMSVAAKAPPVITEERHDFFPARRSISAGEAVPEESSPQQGADKSLPAADREKGALPSLPTGPQESAAPPDSTQEGSPPTVPAGPDETGTYPNGYRFPKKHTWTQSVMIGLRAFWKFFLTPFGFLVTLYGLNVVAWGAMIFFVLLKAAPAMCHPNCEDKSSARQKWIEIDSQILNGLFCVTAFGLFPWRARDFYYLMRWRVGGKQSFHRRLAGIYRSWYRLPGSELLPDDVGPPPVYSNKHPRTPEAPPPFTADEIAELEKNPAIPLPATSMPEPPLTGIRAPPSKSWTIDFVVYMYMLNTMFQVLLCVWMWHWNRFDRPTWGTGVWITFGCLVAISAGVMVFKEGSKIKRIEGIPVQEYDVLESVDDYQERKAKDDKKAAKKQAHHHRHHRHDDDHDENPVAIVRSEKLKGHQWFTRH